MSSRACHPILSPLLGLGLGLGLALGCAGCDTAEADPTIAKAMQIESEMEVAAAKVADLQHADAQAKREAEAARVAARDTALRTAASLPAELPKDLKSACDASNEAFDAFMQAGSERDVLQWWDGHRKKLGDARGKCLKRESIEVAACSAKLLEAAPAEVNELPRRDAARVIVQTCMDKFGAHA